MPVRHYRRLLAAVIALIAYGSLFPFTFRSSPDFRDFFFIPGGPGGFRDVLLNLLLYVPIGFLAFHSVGRGGRPTRVAVAAIFGTAISGMIELLQAFDPPRDCGISDIVCNGLGALMGAMAAAVWHAGAPPALRLSARARARAPAFVLLFWILFQLFPLMPEVHVHFALSRARMGMRQWSGFEAALFAVDWLTALLLLAEVIPERFTRAAALLVFLAPVKAIVFSRQATLSELIGAAAAAVAFLLLARSQGVVRVFPVVLLLALIARELAPFHVTGHAPFLWMPFAATLAGERLSATAILLRKVFVYGAAIQFVSRAWRHIWLATGAIAALLFVLEWIQRAMPARTPEITDSVLALLMGAALALLRRERHRSDETRQTEPQRVR